MKPPGDRREALAVLAVLGAVAVAWTWPAAGASADAAVGRHFDLPGTVWLLSAARRFVTGAGGVLQDPLTAWPTGADYDHPDSFVLLALARLLGAIDPYRLHGLLQVVGVASSAMAAAWLAHRLGARWRWAGLAGLAFACSGPAATALIEGHAYLAVDPWLPLGLLAWLAATGPRGRAWQGLAAALLLGLTGLTSAYLGLVAATLAGVVLVGALLRRDGLRPVPVALGVVCGVLVAAAYVVGFAGGPADVLADYSPQARASYLLANSADLAGMLVADPAVDRFGHAKTATLPWTSAVLTALAPVVLRDARPRGSGRLVAGALLLLLLALGPWLDLGLFFVPLPGLALSWLSQADLLKHPARLMWGVGLCVGVVAALVGTRLEARVGRRSWPLLGAALVDAFVVCGMPARQGSVVLGTPAAYGHATGPVLELLTDQPGYAYELDAWSQAWACVAQAGHGRAIAQDCVATNQDQEPGRRRSRAVVDHLLRGDAAGARALLDADGFAAVALRPDLFDPRDLGRMAPALAVLDPAPARSTDAGALVEVYDLGGGAPISPAGARAPGAVDPNDKQLRVARSLDGRTWRLDEGVLATAASSPDLVQWQGQAWVYFVDHGERLARVPLAGGTPELLDVELGEGLVVDPDLVVLPDGRLRLYAVVQPRMQDPGAGGLDNQIRSALSTDGLHFLPEPGVRLAGPFVDPDVVLLDGGGARMYVTQDATRIRSASAVDGLRFELEPGDRIRGGGVSCSLATTEGITTWYHERWGIRRATAPDGLRFGPSTLDLASGEEAWESPTVLAEGSGFVMVVGAAPAGDAP